MEVFKTNVRELSATEIIIHKLFELMPAHCINFDLEDCDRILRIEADVIDVIAVTACLEQEGYNCKVLD